MLDYFANAKYNKHIKSNNALDEQMKQGETNGNLLHL